MNSASPSTSGSSTGTFSPPGNPAAANPGCSTSSPPTPPCRLSTRLVLFDGKQVELGMWDDIADEFVGPDLDHAIVTLLRLQKVMDNRYTWLRAYRRRKIEPRDQLSVIVAVFDEIALYSATLGTEQQQKLFIALLRDLVARGRAAGIIVIAATQRPSVDIIPKSLRDIFGYRAAFRCTSSGSSNIILGDGWSEAGFSATDILPTNRAPLTSSPKAASPASSKSPTSPTATSPRWPTTRHGPAKPLPPRQHSPHRHTSPNPDNPDA